VVGSSLVGLGRGAGDGVGLGVGLGAEPVVVGEAVVAGAALCSVLGEPLAAILPTPRMVATTRIGSA
jgi:hypothetical protein